MDERLIFLILIIILILAGIIYTAYIYLPLWRSPMQVRKSLSQSEGNIYEYLKVLRFYQRGGDQSKLSSLYFLLENIHLHYHVKVCLQTSEGNLLNYNASDYPDFLGARAALDSLEQNHGELSWHVEKVDKDLHTMTSQLLTENIEIAYKAWKSLPWSVSYAETTFRNYILPYRGSSEPLESFRPYFLDKFSGCCDTADPVRAAAVINEKLKEIFEFNSKYYLHPTDLSLSEMLQSKMGRCEDMTNLAIYAMRANGIAVTSDYTPHWADSGNNHAWNAVLSADGRAIPFMGCESNPGEYKLRTRIAKVYRKMYSEQPSSLGCQLQEAEKAPAWLRSKNYLDVTSSYVDTATVNIEVDSLAADSVRFLYLAVFNSGNWEAIAWSRLENGRAKFKEMGIDLVYLPAYFHNDELVPAAEVFLLNKNGEQKELIAADKLQSMEVRSTTRMKIKNSTGTNEFSNLKPGSEYELFYWQKGWEKAARQKNEDGILRFDGVPSSGLYWLREVDSPKEERIFLYKDNQQIWY